MASLSDVVTVTFCVPPLAGALQVVGVTVNVADPAACVTEIAWPATVAVALRLVTDALVAAVSVTLPLPAPVGELTVSQLWSLVAVHAASLSDAVTVTLCVPPPTGAVQLVGVTVKVADPAACVTLMA